MRSISNRKNQSLHLVCTIFGFGKELFFRLSSTKLHTAQVQPGEEPAARDDTLPDQQEGGDQWHHILRGRVLGRWDQEWEYSVNKWRNLLKFTMSYTGFPMIKFILWLVLDTFPQEVPEAQDWTLPQSSRLPQGWIREHWNYNLTNIYDLSFYIISGLKNSIYIRNTVSFRFSMFSIGSLMSWPVHLPGTVPEDQTGKDCWKLHFVWCQFVCWF